MSNNDTLLINKQQKKKQRHHHHQQLPTRFTRSRLEQELYVSSGTEQLNNSKGVNNQLLQEQQRVATQNALQYFEESRDNGEEEESTMTPSMGDNSNVRLNEVSSSRGINSAVTPSPNKDDDEQPQLSPEELAARAQRKANYPLKDIPEPGPNDCLFGRGGGTNHHPGNKLYRKAVENKKQKYLSSKRLDKPLVAMEIINDWRNMDPPGRFLRQNSVTKLWDDVGDKKAREKTSQALREKTPVKQREGGGGLSNNNNTGREQGNYHTHADREQRTRFEPGTTSPRGRNIKQLSLARDHSLGTEIIGANEISLEGFSWENDDDGDVHAGVGGPPPLPPPPNLDHQQHQQHGHHHHHNYPPPQYYQHGGNEQYYQQQHYGGEHQHPPPPHPEQHGHHPPPYPYVREHSLSNNPPTHPHDSNVTHPAPPPYGNNHPSSSTHPPPPPSYYGHHHYPPSSRHGPPPPPPHPGHPRRQFYSPSQQQQHNQHHYLQHGSGGGPAKPPKHERSRQHSLQMNPLNGATTAQAARGDAFNEEDESSSAPSVYDRPPPLPPPSPYYGYPPTPSQHSQQRGGGWPTPPGGHTSQFTHLTGSNPSAFGQYNTDDRKDSLFSLGSSIDNYYDKQRNSNASSTTAAASRTSGSTITTKGGAINNSDDESGERENPASAGTSQDYSKIADLIRDSSDKTHSSADSRRSISLDNIAGATKGGEEDGITKSKSLPCEENGGVASPGADEPKKQPWVDDKEHNNSNLMRKLSGGALSRGNNTPTPPAGIMRPQTLRPEVVKRDTSNQPETLETKRSVKRVVLSRDQSAVARRLKEEQLALYNNNYAADGSDGGVRVVSSKLTKAEMLDRKMSVEMEKLGIAEIDAAMGAAGAELNVGGGHNNLNRMTTEDIMNAVGGAPVLDRMTTDAFLTSLIDTPEEEGETAAATGSPPQLGERVTTIDAIALDIATGKPSSGSWDDDTLDLVNQNEHVNAEIAEKWLKGKS